MDIMFNDVQEVCRSMRKYAEVCRSSSLAISSSADICRGSMGSIVAVHPLSEAAWSHTSIQACSSIYRIYANTTVDKKIISKFTFIRLDS